ncbi:MULTISPECIES: hypothetical protein [Staphylococcus]|uniref:hypothetical protein n=1 Tax=Staphylococcus TaxID=1279 RepID=UPI0026FEF099|nr:hypothetical protein [Staphylococcus xylosus]
MFITKQELKNINVKQAFDEGANFIKITNGRHTIFRVNGKYRVEDYKSNRPLDLTSKMPKYIKVCL